MTEYETRQFHEVDHVYSLVFGGNTKPQAILLTEPKKKERKFFGYSDNPKKTEFPIKS